jgi:hypothetical protein
MPTHQLENGEMTMAKIGLNHRLSVAKDLKAETRAVYEGVLGATVTSPRPDVEVFTFSDGSGIGVFYVEPTVALTPAEHMNAIWLEFEVDNEVAAAAALGKLGLRPFEYFDKEHKYFQAPGGQAFRLARSR